MCVIGGKKEFSQKLGRSVRLTRIIQLLHSHQRGLTVKELSELCGASVRTIQRDLVSLETDLNVPLTQDKYRYGMLGDFFLPPISFSLYEAVALFLAARLATRHIDEANLHFASALYKMSTALPHHLDEKVQSTVLSIREKRKNPHFVRIFEQIALAWTTCQQINMLYRSLSSEEAKEWTLEPYYLEMSGTGDSTYVIGHAEREGKEGIFTFKLDRIEQIELTGRNFQVPPDVHIEDRLDRSWGVIWGEDVEVILKFSTEVTRRVKETVWHPSQTIRDLPDDGCLMKLTVGSVLEITPWIRSWGPDVEVVAPDELRKRFREWSETLYAMYRC